MFYVANARNTDLRLGDKRLESSFSLPSSLLDPSALSSSYLVFCLLYLLDLFLQSASDFLRVLSSNSHIFHTP